jgi:hypothetical protein
VGILLYKQFLDVELSWIRFMIQSSWLISILGVLLVAYSAWYFQQHLSSQARRQELPVAS